MMANTRPYLFIITSCCLVATLAFTATSGLQSVYHAWKTGRLVSQLASDDDSERSSALQALKDRNMDVRPHLIPLLRHESIDVRRFAASSLNEEIPFTDQVVNAFIAVATDETQDQLVRTLACFTFQQMWQQAHGPPTEVETDMINALTTVLHSSDTYVVASAASALSEFGPAAASAESDLWSVLNTGSEISRVNVAGALLAIRPTEHVLILPVLLDVVQGTDKVASSDALYLLGMLGPDASSAIPVLENVVRKNPDLSHEVEEAIELIKAEGRDGHLTK